MARLLAGFFSLYLITIANSSPFVDVENIPIDAPIYEGRDIRLYFAEDGNSVCLLPSNFIFLLQASMNTSHTMDGTTILHTRTGAVQV